MIDPNSAPDGEEYFVMALMFAQHRWSNGNGIYDYETEADMILHEMVHETRCYNPTDDRSGS